MRSSPARIFESVTTAVNLARIYHDHVQNGVARGRDGVAPDSLDTELGSISALLRRKLRAGEYSYTQYKEHLKSKGAGREPRVISVPTARDRIALRALADSLVQVYPQARGVIPQVRVREVTDHLRTRKFDSFVRIDVKSFYPSIAHEQVASAIKRRIRKPEILNAVMDAVKTPTVPDRTGKRPPTTCGVPQGLAISNVLSELVIHPVDAALLAESSYAYFRFVDDILILCNEPDIDTAASTTFGLLRNQGLEGHPLNQPGGKSTTGRITEKFEYLGYRFDGPTVSVREDSVLSIEARIAREFARYRRARKSTRNTSTRALENRVNLAITGCIWDSTAYGWLFYFRQMNDLTLLKKLDLSVDRLKRRFDVPQSVKFKKFMTAYWAVLHPSSDESQYIPRFDGLSINQMREILAQFMSSDEVGNLHDRAVPRTFRTLMTRLTAELERDIGDFS